MTSVEVDLTAAMRLTILKDQALYEHTGRLAKSPDVSALACLMPQAELVLLEHVIKRELLKHYMTKPPVA
jgi:hypothetical protein